MRQYSKYVSTWNRKRRGSYGKRGKSTKRKESRGKGRVENEMARHQVRNAFIWRIPKWTFNMRIKTSSAYALGFGCLHQPELAGLKYERSSIWRDSCLPHFFFSLFLLFRKIPLFFFACSFLGPCVSATPKRRASKTHGLWSVEKQAGLWWGRAVVEWRLCFQWSFTLSLFDLPWGDVWTVGSMLNVEPGKRVSTVSW